jgi:hypothetical protein
MYTKTQVVTVLKCHVYSTSLTHCDYIAYVLSVVKIMHHIKLLPPGMWHNVVWQTDMNVSKKRVDSIIMVEKSVQILYRSVDGWSQVLPNTQPTKRHST